MVLWYSFDLIQKRQCFRWSYECFQLRIEEETLTTYVRKIDSLELGDGDQLVVRKEMASLWTDSFLGIWKRYQKIPTGGGYKNHQTRIEGGEYGREDEGTEGSEGRMIVSERSVIGRNRDAETHSLPSHDSTRRRDTASASTCVMGWGSSWWSSWHYFCANKRSNMTIRSKLRSSCLQVS